MKTAAKQIVLLLILHVYSLTSAAVEDNESHSAMPEEKMGSNELNIESPVRNKKICRYLFNF